MTYDLTEEVKSIGSLNFEGNVIPIEWFSSIRLPNEKPDLISIVLLSDIIYWYRPSIIRDEISGKIISYKKKFKADLLQKSYKELEDLFGFSSKQLREAFIRLEKLGLLKREFRTISSKGIKLSNVMFIRIFPKKIEEITTPDPASLEGNTYSPVGNYLAPHEEPSASTQVRTYTKTTTKTTTKNSFSNNKGSNISLINSSTSKKYEREREMIKIWDKIIRENEKPSVCNQTRLEALKKTIEDNFGGCIKSWENYCWNIKASDFLMGGGPNSWKVDLIWATKPDNLIRIYEGYYHKQKEKDVIIDTESISEEEEINCSDPIWNKVKIILKKKKGEGTYKSWFKKLELKGYDKDKVLFYAPTQFIKNWILNNFKEDVISSFKQVNKIINEVEILLKEDEKSTTV